MYDLLLPFILSSLRRTVLACFLSGTGAPANDGTIRAFPSARTLRPKAIILITDAVAKFLIPSRVCISAAAGSCLAT